MGKNAIPADMLVRCDTYSLGLLYLQVMHRDLDAAWTSKTEDVLGNVVNFVQEYAGLSADLTTTICMALKQLLPYHAADRCGNLAVVLNILKSFELSDITDIWYVSFSYLIRSDFLTRICTF
jgi:hypothetical protein